MTSSQFTILSLNESEMLSYNMKGGSKSETDSEKLEQKLKEIFEKAKGGVSKKQKSKKSSKSSSDSSLSKSSSSSSLSKSASLSDSSSSSSVSSSDSESNSDSDSSDSKKKQKGGASKGFQIWRKVLDYMKKKEPKKKLGEVMKIAKKYFDKAKDENKKVFDKAQNNKPISDEDYDKLYEKTKSLIDKDY